MTGHPGMVQILDKAIILPLNLQSKLIFEKYVITKYTIGEQIWSYQKKKWQVHYNYMDEFTNFTSYWSYNITLQYDLWQFYLYIFLVFGIGNKLMNDISGLPIKS